MCGIQTPHTTNPTTNLAPMRDIITRDTTSRATTIQYTEPNITANTIQTSPLPRDNSIINNHTRDTTTTSHAADTSNSTKYPTSARYMAKRDTDTYDNTNIQSEPTTTVDLHQ